MQKKILKNLRLSRPNCFAKLAITRREAITREKAMIQGFSLLEMLITLVIFSVFLLTLGLGQYHHLQTTTRLINQYQDQNSSHNQNEQAREQGYTLIELLVVLALTLFITTGLFNLSLSITNHHQYTKAHLTLAEDATSLQHTLDYIIHGAGFLGLSTWNAIPVYDQSLQELILSPINIFSATSSKLPSNIQKKIKPNTVALETSQMDYKVIGLTKEAYLGENTLITTLPPATFDNNTKIVIADTQHAEINSISSMKKISSLEESIQLVYPLHNTYAKNAYVGKYFDRLYFIGDTGYKFPDKKPIYGLYRYSESDMTEELSDILADWNIDYYPPSLTIHATLKFPQWIRGHAVQTSQDFKITLRQL